MGVHSLWKILEPSSRAVRLESLTKRRLAIDASIWIYQFLKAVRDKSGASLTKSHIVGFFRRICKLIYFGILPVFVFDGGAPILKRQTILKRKERRQGKRENAESTAKRLLAIQLQRNQESPTKKTDEPVYKYMDQIDKPVEQPKFRGDDDYHLPELDGFHHKTSDTRIIKDTDTSNLTQANEDELDGIDLNTIDPSSKEFNNLPITTQYMVLSQLRLRSRLRMGYSKQQLEDIFPNSLDFSKFQIQMVQKRNYFTQKLMGISGMDVDLENKYQEIKRIAGERGKAYKISKNEGGWSLSLNDEDNGSSINNAIDLEKELKRQKQKEENPLKQFSDDDDDDIEWEDIPLNGEVEKKVSYSIGSLPLPPRPHDEKSGTIRSFTFSPEKKKSQQKIEDYDEIEELEEDILDQVQQTELREAIEESKKQYFEELASNKVTKESTVNEESDEDYNDIFEDIEISSSSLKPKPKPTIPENSDEKAIDIFKDMGIPSTLAIPKQQPKQVAAPSKLNFRTEMDSLLLFKDPDSSMKEKNEKVSSFSKLEETPKKNKVVEKKAVPSWFNSNFDLNIKSSSLLSPKPKITSTTIDSESDNLVPWFEAEEIIKDQNKNIDGEVIEIEEITNDKVDEENNDVIEITDEIKKDKNVVIEPILNGGNNSKKIEEVPELSTVSQKEITIGSPDVESMTSNTGTSPISDPTPTPASATEPTSERASEPAPPPIMDYEFFESDEEELENQLIEEEKEHEQFTKELNPALNNSINVDLLQKEHASNLRDSDEVSQDMIKDVQELLSFFGIPYVTAPMEAEAQCAELLQLGLVDGIITDDSDVFLFGGDKVYKNMFHEKHYVEYYNGANLEKDLGLDREKLINLAHLLGSDYTEGLKGIGPVNSMEILAHFDGKLENFRNWFVEGQFDLNKQQEESTFLKNLRKKLIKNEILLDNTFPDKNIDQAYLQPEVDSDKTKFQWGKPDLDKIREYLMERVGWSKERVDEVLIPLIKHLNKKEREGAQSTITEFYEPGELRGMHYNVPKKNKRIEQASGKIKRRKK